MGLYAIVAGAILSPLLLKRGYPFAFDMSFGPEMKIPPEAFGLGAEFGRRLPDFIWLSILAEVVPSEVVVRIVLSSIPLASGLTAHFASKRVFGGAGLGAGGALYAGLLYEVNPFVYQRFAAGHWHILLGYAFFPLVVVAGTRLCAAAGGRLRRRALWFTALISALLGSVSFAVSVMGLMTLLVAVLVLGSRGARGGSRRHLTENAALAGQVIAAWIPGNATWIVPGLLKSSKAGGFTDLDWRAFLVRGDDQWEALLNVLRLSGFYRGDLAPPSLARLSGWLAATAVVGLFIAGLAVLYRRDHGLFAFSLIVPAAFLFLALGERAPILGPVLGWAYPRTPGWQIFRETQKLVVPVCFFYAAIGGVGASRLTAYRREQPGAFGREEASDSAEPGGPSISTLERSLVLVAVLLLPLALTPDVFFGLRGRIAVSEYPPGWYEAARALPPGDGKLIVFPWHQHMPFGFTGGRTNVNPAADFFPREVVQSTRAEFPGFILGVADPVDTYVRDFVSLGPVLTDTAEALSPLGADSVLLLKTADWEAYEFLEKKPDLQKVVDNDDLRLYMVVAPSARVSGFRSARAWPPDSSTRVQTGPEASTAEPRLEAEACPPGGGRLTRRAPYAYEIPEAGCWLVPEVYERGWRSPGVAGPVWSGAAMGVSAGGPGRVVYAPAYVAIGGHLITAATLILAALGVMRSRWRETASSAPAASGPAVSATGASETAADEGPTITT